MRGAPWLGHSLAQHCSPAAQATRGFQLFASLCSLPTDPRGFQGQVSCSPFSCSSAGISSQSCPCRAATRDSTVLSLGSRAWSIGSTCKRTRETPEPGCTRDLTTQRAGVGVRKGSDLISRHQFSAFDSFLATFRL